MGRVEQVDVDAHGDVAALRGAGARSSSEERVEQVADRAERVEVGRVAAGAQAVVAVAVIRGATLAVGQDLVRLGSLLELLLGCGIVGVDVGVQLAL